ncbi:trace amine-associated receptor 13c-like [Triplophysa rosa]|uniref:Taar9 protein n=1 Tax=Triplophysa rosa TaxID=992332 RepID=A0A9W7WAB8_TRIRA|nr:trace amine-associated receptor 13c-like [Triplophysa rosa]KAI7793472.1 Taar9 protein [Triplophysa rosa]
MAYETEDDETQYCFPAVNSSCIKTKRSTHESNVMYVFFSLLSVWTVFLNLLVIISISHFKKLHTPTNLLILSLAVADMLVGLIIVPIEGIKLTATCWYFGDSFCGLYSMFIGLLLSASLCNLALVAIDRYVAVCHPLEYPQKITTSRTLAIVCFSWFWSSAYNILFITHNGYFNRSSIKDVCYGQCPFLVSFAWSVTDLFVSFLVPCTLIITLYLRIFYIAQQHVKVINSLMKSGKHVTEGSARRKSESKAALTLGIIVSVYLFCWIPYYIISAAGDTLIPPTTANSLMWALYCNSSLNPLVYAFFYSWFKKSVKHILTLKILQQASPLVNITVDYHS